MNKIALKILAISCVLANAALAETKRPPNVILIMADDVSWECFGAYGAEDYKTPNIDALAAEGIQFANCYSTPICTPSRVKLMTGKYSFRNYTHFGYLDPKEKTFGHLLQEAGYKTAIAGKWQLNGLTYEMEGSDDSSRPIAAGFDEYCLWQLTQPKPRGERFWSPVLETNGKLLSEVDTQGQYGPDIMSDFICDFIGRNKDQPYFAYYPMVLVHNPFVPTTDTIGSAPRTQDANKAPKSDELQKKNFVAMVNYMDGLVGKIVRKVEETGQLENTIILFTADNGTNTAITSRWNGQDIQGGKGGTTDMGTHVPFVAYWNGHTPKGVVLEDLIDFTDFYLTLAEAAGVELGEEDPSDGQSFLPQLKGQEGNLRRWVFNHYQPYWADPEKFPGTQYARDEHFKLYRDGSFYNVPEDLREQNDLAGVQTNEGEGNSYRKLNEVLESAPPAPPIEGGRDATERPIYPKWNKMVDSSD